jgi:hypothetical protein
MKILCDVCEGAAARLFCAADEAALCLRCDEKVVEIPFFFFPSFSEYKKKKKLAPTIQGEKGSELVSV